MYEIVNGVSNSELRESFGYCGKHLSLESTSMYLFPEECRYAFDKGLVSNWLSCQSQKDVEFFYIHMRNKGFFLTRNITLDEVLQLTNLKRQKVENSDIEKEVEKKYIVYDCYPDKQSFNKKEVAGSKPQICILWLETEVDFDILGQLGHESIQLALVKQS